jgi:hypothetical protein
MTAMKLILNLLAMTVIAFSFMTACSKSRSVPPGLVGDWKMIKAGGGFVGMLEYKGVPIILQLRPDGTYVRYHDGSPAEAGVYALSVNTTGVRPDSIFTFSYDTTSYKRGVSSSGGQLFLVEPTVEGIEELFQKFE